MSNWIYLDAGSFKKPVDVFLVTNCIDDAYVYISETKANKKMKEFPNYVVYIWPKLKYREGYTGEVSLSWKRPRKLVGDKYQFDDTKTPWQMLLLAKEKKQWYTNRRFGSITYAMEQFGGREYYNIHGYAVPKEKETKYNSIWVSGFGDARIDDKNWLIEYKNKLHQNDDWTIVNVETYARYIHCIDNKEHTKLVDDALKANVVGFLD